MRGTRILSSACRHTVSDCVAQPRLTAQEQSYCTIEDAEAPLHFDSEIDVTGRINNIDTLIAPETGCSGRRDRDSALLLLDHPIHRRCAFMHFADLVVDPGVVEHTLGRGRFAG